MALRAVTLTGAEAAECNAADPPRAGVHVGGGVHVEIPADYAARILAGERVPGCTYYVSGEVTQVDDALPLSPSLATKVLAAPVAALAEEINP